MGGKERERKRKWVWEGKRGRERENGYGREREREKEKRRLHFLSPTLTSPACLLDHSSAPHETDTIIPRRPYDVQGLCLLSVTGQAITGY